MKCSNIFQSFHYTTLLIVLQEHKDGLPTFMGMPLYGLKKEKEEKKKEPEREEDLSGLEGCGDPFDLRGSSKNGMYSDFGSSRAWKR